MSHSLTAGFRYYHMIPVLALVGATVFSGLIGCGSDTEDGLDAGAAGAGAAVSQGGDTSLGGQSPGGGGATDTGAGGLAAGAAGDGNTGGLAAGGSAGLVGVGGTGPGGWVHPGALEGIAELEFVKTQLAASGQPWTRQLNSMKNIEKLTQAPAPQVSLDANSGAADAARDDARRAYGNALVWALTGDDAAGKQAVAYLNAWSGLQAITATNDQGKLVAGWLGSLWGPAAELMLAYPGWAPADIEKTRAMFKRAFYPQLNTASTWNGNVDLHQISAMMAISVFNEDKAEFDAGLARLDARMPAYFFLVSDGKPASIAGDGGNSNTFWSNPTKWVDGLTQETCRDNNHHAQFAMSAAIGAMETAWHQGVDVYTKYQPRMVAAMELMGLQSSSGDMQGTCANNTTSASVYDTWEIGYNHYHTRRGVPMPNTWAMISPKVRAYESNPGSWSIFYETLTHADIVYVK